VSWLVTGSYGQLGVEIQLALKNAGVECLPFGSKELDITNETKVNQAIERYRPEIILNTAAWTDVDGAETEKDRVFDVNANGPKYLAQAAKKHGSTLIHVSTDYVFSGLGKQPWQEFSIREPKTVYGLSKLEGEKKVQEYYPENSFIVRTAWLYSQHRSNFLKKMVKIATTSKESIKVVCDQVGQPTYAKDLAAQILSLQKAKAKSGIYHGTNSGQASWHEFALEIFELCGEDSSRVIPAKSSDYIRPANRPLFSVLGHAGWEHSNVPAMRNWKIALMDAIKEINFNEE
jgi:dTDP-4-dehydrorhamnose reductase